MNTYEGTHDVHALILGRAQTGLQAVLPNVDCAELARGLAGPKAVELARIPVARGRGQTLADLGAEVIKVEEPGRR